MVRALIGFAITAYQRLLFRPRLGRTLSLLLAQAVRLRRGDMFVHDAGGLKLHVDLT